MLYLTDTIAVKPSAIESVRIHRSARGVIVTMTSGDRHVIDADDAQATLRKIVEAA